MPEQTRPAGLESRVCMSSAPTERPSFLTQFIACSAYYVARLHQTITRSGYPK